MKRLTISKSLSELEATNSLIVQRTKRDLRRMLIADARKHGSTITPAAIVTTEKVETLTLNPDEPHSLRIITMRVDIP